MTVRLRPGLTAAVCLLLGAAAWLRLGPLPPGLLDFTHAESTRIEDRHGELLYEARNADGGRTSWLEPGDVPRTLAEATIAAEDRRFHGHIGVDPVAVLRAVAHNVRQRRVVEGGSTITQQVVKLLLARRAPSARRGPGGKVREALLALRLEHRLSKAEILTLYLNLAPYGNQLTGANRASEAYFGHDASLLTAAQAAFLASLPQRPTGYNPYRDLTRARRRQARVIARMGLDGALTPDEVRTALAERLRVEPPTSAFIAPHFVERVLAGAGAARPPRITTTLDAALQRDVRGIIDAARPTLSRYGAHNVAVAVMDNRTGGWLAWEGSGGYDDRVHGGRIDGVVTPRQPGSALKPFTYALAFEEGDSPATVLPDVPSFFQTVEAGVVYGPRNYDNRFRGPMRARRALAGSENVPAVVLASRLGVANLLRFLRSAGLTTFDQTASYYGVGLTLGNAEVRLDEMVAAYAAFARGGTFLPPRFVAGAPSVAPRTLVSPRTAFWITDVLSDADARAFAFGRGGSLEFPFEVAAKTGTSQAYHDNWAIGYTRAVTVGVWVGNFDRTPLVGSSGVMGAGPIFHAVMLAAANRAGEALPDPIDAATSATPVRTSRQTICALSGLPAGPDCPNQEEEWVPDDGPRAACDWHRRTPRGIVVDWPSAFQGWAASARLVGAVVAPVRATSVAAAGGSSGEQGAGQGRAHLAAAPVPSRVTGRPGTLQVLNPPDGAVYLIDPTLRPEFQTLALRGAAAGSATIEWRVDDRRVGAASPGASVDWPLVPGRHRVSAHVADGRAASVDIVVR